jgi:hypothetical protein
LRSVTKHNSIALDVARRQTPIDAVLAGMAKPSAWYRAPSQVDAIRSADLIMKVH